VIVTIALVARKAHQAGAVNWTAYGAAAGAVTLAYLAVRFWKKSVRQRRLRREAEEAVARHQDPLDAPARDSGQPHPAEEAVARHQDPLGVRRQQIDAVDQEMVALLSERARLVLKVWAEKERRGLPRFDPTRTRGILEDAVRHNPGPLTDDQVRELMGMILDWYLRDLDRAPEPARSDQQRKAAQLAGTENGGR